MGSTSRRRPGVVPGPETLRTLGLSLQPAGLSCSSCAKRAPAGPDHRWATSLACSLASVPSANEVLVPPGIATLLPQGGVVFEHGSSLRIEARGDEELQGASRTIGGRMHHSGDAPDENLLIRVCGSASMRSLEELYSALDESGCGIWRTWIQVDCPLPREAAASVFMVYPYVESADLDDVPVLEVRFGAAAPFQEVDGSAFASLEEALAHLQDSRASAPEGDTSNAVRSAGPLCTLRFPDGASWSDAAPVIGIVCDPEARRTRSVLLTWTGGGWVLRSE